MHQDRANNPLKLPLFILGGVAGGILIVLGAWRGSWETVVAGALVLALSSAAIAVIRRGHNPWWIRAPLDYVRRRK